MYTSAGPPRDLVQQILTPGVGQSMVFIEWRPLLNAEGIGYSVQVSTRNFLNLVSDDPSFNFTASHNVEYLVSVAADIRCSGVRPAPLLLELGMSSGSEVLSFHQVLGLVHEITLLSPLSLGVEENRWKCLQRV